MATKRQLRQAAGFLSARFSQLSLDEVSDPRKPGNIRWRLKPVLQCVLACLLGGCRSLKELEQMSDNFGTGTKRLLGIKRRLPDTTVRDLLCRLDPEDLRGVLQQANLLAFRRKAHKPVRLPFGFAAMDGKCNTLPIWDREFIQRQSHDNIEHGLLRTVTSVLSSARAKPCLDVHPIPHDTNEMGVFAEAFTALCRRYGSGFQVVTYDAGASSEDNAQTVVSADKDYIFSVKNKKHKLFQLIQESLAGVGDVARSVDHVSHNTHLIRRVSLFDVEAHRYLYAEEGMWRHAKTFVKIETFRMLPDGSPLPVVEPVESRLYISSLQASVLDPQQWLGCIRGHWAVENNGHHTLDAVFREDDKPWIEANAKGALVMLILRRIAYTLLSLLRSVTLRSAENRKIPWRTLIGRIHVLLYKADENLAEGLRARKTVTVCG